MPEGFRSASRRHLRCFFQGQAVRNELEAEPIFDRDETPPKQRRAEKLRSSTRLKREWREIASASLSAASRATFQRSQPGSDQERSDRWHTSALKRTLIEPNRTATGGPAADLDFLKRHTRLLQSSRSDEARKSMVLQTFLVYRTSFAPETISPEGSEHDQSLTKIRGHFRGHFQASPHFRYCS